MLTFQSQCLCNFCTRRSYSSKALSGLMDRKLSGGPCSADQWTPKEISWNVRGKFPVTLIDQFWYATSFLSRECCMKILACLRFGVFWTKKDNVILDTSALSPPPPLRPPLRSFGCLKERATSLHLPLWVARRRMARARSQRSAFCRWPGWNKIILCQRFTEIW